jgi:hypothetical protein
MQPTVVFARGAIVLAGLICALPAGAESTPQPQPPALTPSQMRDDLYYLRHTWAAADLTFDAQERKQFDFLVSRMMVDADTLTPSGFALEVARAVAVSGNGHTEAAFGDYIRRTPLRAWWFADGLFIVKTHPQFKHLLGAQIQKIGDLPVEQALTKVTPFLPGTDLWRKTLSPKLLTSPDVLHHVGITADANEARFTLRMANGKVQTIKVAAQPGRDPNGGGYWKDLIPADSQQAERWPHVLDTVAKRSPIYGAPADVAVEWLGADNEVIYLRSNQVYSQDNIRLDDKFMGIMGEVVYPTRPKYAIVDLRLNTGGDFSNTVLFTQVLPRLIPPDGKIFVLIGPNTFSAALTTAAWLKANGGERSVLVGEHMGDSDQFWAEGQSMTLPNSKLAIRASNGYHDWGRGCHDRDKCFWLAYVFAVKGLSLEPQIPVTTSFADYAAGRDPVLEAALALAK